MKDTVLQKLRWDKTGPLPGFDAVSVPPEVSTRYAVLKSAIQEGGLPRPPSPMTVADETRFLLKAVAEVEHALLVQYLYAAYSIPKTGAPAVVSAHHRRLITIAVEEMGHLITAQNLLMALGAPTHFDRDDTVLGKKSAGEYPFHIRFEPLSPDSLAKYVTAESPPIDRIEDPALRARVEPVFERAEQSAGRVINHVGVLFAYVFWLFQPNDDPHPGWPELPALMPPGLHLADADFDFSSEPRQAMPEEFGADDNVHVFSILSRDDALHALDKIAEQGEGWNIGSASHFERFLDCYERFEDELSGHILNIPTDPTTSCGGNGPETEESCISHEAALQWARLLNVRYRLVLLELGLAMLRPRESDDDSLLSRPALIDASLTEMRHVVRYIAIRLTGLPRRPEGSTGEVAAAPFELPDISFPNDEAGIRQGIREALIEAGQLMERLRQLPPPHEPSTADLSFIGNLEASDNSLVEAIGS